MEIIDFHGLMGWDGKGRDIDICLFFIFAEKTFVFFSQEFGE